MNIFQIVFAIFLAIFLIVSLWYGRKTTLRDFYVMRGEAGHILIAGTYLATWVSAVGMIGLSGVAYQHGILPGMFTWGAFPGFVISGFFIGNRLRRLGQVTLGDYYVARFGGANIHFLSTIIVIVGLGAYFISQLIGSALVTESILGIPYNVMLPLMVAVFAIIAIIGGARTVTITDTIMAVVIALSIGCFFSLSLMSNIGMNTLKAYAKENPSLFTYTGGALGWGTIIGWQVLWCFGNAANPASITRCNLAKDSRTWVKAIMLSLMVCLPLVWMTQLSAFFVRMVNPNLSNPAQAIIWGATSSYVPSWIGALAIAGLFAAVLSTASTQILILAFSVSRDIYERYGKFTNKEERDKKSLFQARLWIAIFSIAAILLAWGKPNYIYLAGNFGSSVFAAAFFPSLITGLWWKKTTKAGALASMAVGLVLDAILSFYPVFFLGKPLGWAEYLPWGIHPVIWSLIIAQIVVIIVSLITQNTITKEQIEVYTLCRTPEPQEHRTSKTSLIRYTIATAIVGILLFIGICWLGAYIG